MNEELDITQEWDKVFPKSNQVSHRKVSFLNHFGTTLVADLYEPEEASEKKLPTIAVSGPSGVVKEQSSGLYAQTMAERGSLMIVFDPSFTGESGGIPRYVVSSDINTEDFQAAVDFLSVQKNVDLERIGIIGTYGWGGMASSAAAIDTRIKAAVVSTIYNMTRAAANGCFDVMDENVRYEMREELNTQRIIDFKQGDRARAGGVVDPLPEDAPQFVKDYHAYYRTDRGYHVRSLNSNDGWSRTSGLSLTNAKLLHYIPEIRHVVLVIHGEKVHSRYFGENTLKELKGDNKELMIIPGTSHTDLYDQADIIPFEKMATFLEENLV